MALSSVRFWALRLAAASTASADERVSTNRFDFMNCRCGLDDGGRLNFKPFVLERDAFAFGDRFIGFDRNNCGFEALLVARGGRGMFVPIRQKLFERLRIIAETRGKILDVGCEASGVG